MSATTPNPPTWSGPGIMQSFVTPLPDSALSQSTLEKWFYKVYLPAVLQTGIVQVITAWKAASPKYKRQWMIVFEVDDLERVQHGHVGGGFLHEIPRASDMFPGGEAVDEFVDFESRILERVEVYGDGGGTADDVNTIIYAAMQPAPGGEKDLDSWYREEHNEQMSREQGYKRTTRYRPLFQTRNSGKDKPGGLDFVAFHQFREGNKVGAEVEPLDPMTEWTRRCMAGCEEIDAAVYRKVKTLTG